MWGRRGPQNGKEGLQALLGAARKELGSSGLQEPEAFVFLSVALRVGLALKETRTSPGVWEDPHLRHLQRLEEHVHGLPRRSAALRPWSSLSLNPSHIVTGVS